ncbi:MAG: diphosphate--fructose-6-phosphate 1-phosphotransferase [Spirochaetales bacterium]|jgi:pyrophosphate--fructose-6-phosphate 1-phosphotransferase|nr:diphosphate--fructose-6-phosphate 1-phosphotransferase [Spirochaetales bacterium]
MEKISALQKARFSYQPKLPEAVKGNVADIVVKLGNPTESVSDQEALKALLKGTYGMPVASFEKGTNAKANDKINVGVILSGGQAPGGHNVIAGLFDGVKNGNKESKLYGFLGGPSGIIEGEYVEITSELIDSYRNTGGFDIIGSGRTKLETNEQFDKSLEVCKKLGITAVVIIGGDDSNTNAALMAEYYKSKGEAIQVIGCPKTIDGDLKNEHIETSFGFDTATKVYSELIGNIERDANSAKKYYHFIKLMGRSASHICLECALQTQPNWAIISEEVEKEQKTLTQVVEEIVNVVVKRAEKGDNFGVILVPEGLIEFIPEMKVLIAELNDLLAKKADEFATVAAADQADWIAKNLTAASSSAFTSLPAAIKAQLCMDRDPHGNVQVSRIETEKLLIEMVGARLDVLKAEGKYKGKFAGLNHFFGYEGRCAAPSNFDADYCYSLGYVAFLLIASGLTGYMSSVKNLAKPATEWVPGGIPTSMMFNMEQRHGEKKPVIRKALVELEGAPYKEYVKYRDEWAANTSYLFPGAIQYYGPAEVCDAPTKTLTLESK